MMDDDVDRVSYAHLDEGLGGERIRQRYQGCLTTLVHFFPEPQGHCVGVFVAFQSSNLCNIRGSGFESGGVKKRTPINHSL